MNFELEKITKDITVFEADIKLKERAQELEIKEKELQ